MCFLTFGVCLLQLSLVNSLAASSDPPTIDRTIRKEPAYRTKAPKYGLLVFGPEAKDPVWLVQDGDTLYVDRNGNGDLTEPGKKVTAEKKPGREEDGYTFEVGDITVGGRMHKGLSVSFSFLKRFADGSLGKRPDVKAALTKDPKAMAVWLGADVEVPWLKGAGRRANFSAGMTDLLGVLQFADTPASAPVVHFGGPLQVTFYNQLPTLRVGRGSELILVVGTPGVGPGTFAMLGYEDIIPAAAKPVVEASVPVAKAGAPPLVEKWVIQDRC
jgi:hypothetical protein